MDRAVDVEEVQRKADAFLENLLRQNQGKTFRETAHHITNLALRDANPVRELFAAAESTSRPTRPASPTQTLRSRTSYSKLFRLSRRDNKSVTSDGRSATSTYGKERQSVHSTTTTSSQGNLSLHSSLSGRSAATQIKSSIKQTIYHDSDSGNKKSSGKSIPNSSCFPTAEKSSKASANCVQYSCIICLETLSSKGVCKRHLEDQHVAPKRYKCEKCGEIFKVKKDVKQHNKGCGRGVLLWTNLNAEAKKIYACEYTGESFASLAKYLEHLLKLCEGGSTRSTRPRPSLHRKLEALLEQPNLREHLGDISQKKHGSRDAWKKLRWTSGKLVKAIEELEYANVQDNGTVEFGDGTERSQNVRVYLNSLLSTGNLPDAAASEETSQSTVSGGASTARARRDSVSSVRSGETAIPNTNGGPVSRTTLQEHAIPAVPEIPNNLAQIASPIHQQGFVTTPLPMEEKSKRHLSDQSRFWVPDRRPPPPTHGPYDMSYNEPIAYSTAYPGTNWTSLPYRSQEHMTIAPDMNMVTTAQSQQTYNLPVTENIVSSDTNSESTTLVSSHREQEVITYDIWPQEQMLQDYPFPFPPGTHTLNMQDPGYYTGSEVSLRSDSIATQPSVYNIGYGNDTTEQKFSTDYQHMVPVHHAAEYGGTFLWDDDDQHDIPGMQ